MTTDRMQARRDAFLMLTDEKPPENPKRWLVVWTEDGMTNYAERDTRDGARTRARHLRTWWSLAPKVYDLDNQ